jgi:hypothetical protein
VLRRLLPLALLFALLPASASAKTVTCKSGHTVISRGHARLFTKKSTFSNGIYSRLYVCSLTVRRPLEIDSDRDYAEARWGQWYASGRYVAYINSWADAVAGGWMLRSVDLATGEVRWREIVDGTGISADNPLAVRIDRDGSMVFLAGGYQPH